MTTETDQTTLDSDQPDNPPQPSDAAPDPAPEIPDDTADVPDDETQEDDAPEDLRAARREAATRRKELRTVEAERDALKGTIATLQRQVAEQLIKTSDDLPDMHDTADLFDIGGVNAADLADDAGGIDIDKLGAALEAFREARPYLFKKSDRSGGRALRESMQRQTLAPAGYNPSSGTEAAWQNALRNG